MFETFMAAVIRTATPIALAAMGGILSTRVGIFNITLEGVMNLGAFVSVFVAFYSLSPMFGVTAAVIAGGLLSLVFIVLVEYFHTHPTLTAIGVNILSTGLTKYMTKLFFQEGTIAANQIVGIPAVKLPFISGIPILDAIISNHTVLVYVAPLVVIVLGVVLYKTQFGIRLHASGENPKALETAGISSRKYRVLGVTFTGLMCGLAGAHLSLGYVTMFSENIVAGRGFIAYAAVMFGKANPFTVYLACLIFGFAEALSYRSQQIGVPAQIISMLPYVVTILALVLQSGHLKKPGHMKKN